jgi:phosphonate transport system ATP-binding protein
MVELLGISVPAADGSWLLHRLCARLRAGEVVAVSSTRVVERAALFDVVAGRRWPAEGRAWITRVPLGKGVRGRARGLVAEVADPGTLTGRRSALWSVLASPGIVSGALRSLRPAQRRIAADALASVGLREWALQAVGSLDARQRARVALASALGRRPAVVVVRDVERLAPLGDRLWPTLADVGRSERVVVLAGVSDPAAAEAGADRILAIADGRVAFDGPAARFSWSVRDRAAALA